MPRIIAQTARPAIWTRLAECRHYHPLQYLGFTCCRSRMGQPVPGWPHSACVRQCHGPRRHPRNVVGWISRSARGNPGRTLDRPFAGSREWGRTASNGGQGLRNTARITRALRAAGPQRPCRLSRLARRQPIWRLLLKACARAKEMCVLRSMDARTLSSFPMGRALPVSSAGPSPSACAPLLPTCSPAATRWRRSMTLTATGNSPRTTCGFRSRATGSPMTHAA